MADKTTADLLGLLHDIPVRKGMLMPLTQFGDNSARLDWTAGLPGSLWEALTAPARAYRGEIPDEQMIPEGLNFAGNVTLGSMAATKPSGALASGAAREAEQPKGFTAFHGSPHDFDKFDMSKIGTGEGAQAYGHGLYFADSEGVARSYRDSLSNDGLGVVARGRLRQFGGDIDKTIEYLRGRVTDGSDAAAVNGRQALNELELAKAAEKTPGKLYQVRINADPDRFLDWDKPLSQQSEAVKGALENVRQGQSNGDRKRVGEAYSTPNNSGGGELAPESISAGDFYKSVSRSLVNGDWGDPGDFARQLASQRLREVGIPGIKYLDQGSRASGEGSRNYVVFDDKLIEILKKYGILGMLGGGALASQPSGPGILSDSMEGK